MKESIDVSPEMVTFVGPGNFPDRHCPVGSIIYYFDGFGEGAAPILGYRPEVSLEGLETAPLVLVVQKEACRRIFDFEPETTNRWHLSTGLRNLALSLIDCEAEGEARVTLRLARSIELLCQTNAALLAGRLLPVRGGRALSDLDVARLANARRILDEHWHEKLTISDLSRLAGINRDKLVSGFRELYNATVAEVLTDRRLSEARRLLLATDLPVSSVAYRCSYLNNASFSRAFSRRFGVAPTQMRRVGVTA